MKSSESLPVSRRNAIFKCPRCEHALCTMEELKTHMKTHEKESLFVCSSCGNGFCSEVRLQLHMRQHARELLEQNWSPQTRLKQVPLDTSDTRSASTQRVSKPKVNAADTASPGGRCLEKRDSHYNVNTANPYGLKDCSVHLYRINRDWTSQKQVQSDSMDTNDGSVQSVLAKSSSVRVLRRQRSTTKRRYVCMSQSNTHGLKDLRIVIHRIKNTAVVSSKKLGVHSPNVSNDTSVVEDDGSTATLKEDSTPKRGDGTPYRKQTTIVTNKSKSLPPATPSDDTENDRQDLKGEETNGTSNTYINNYSMEPSNSADDGSDMVISFDRTGYDAEKNMGGEGSRKTLENTIENDTELPPLEAIDRGTRGRQRQSLNDLLRASRNHKTSSTHSQNSFLSTTSDPSIGDEKKNDSTVCSNPTATSPSRCRPVVDTKEDNNEEMCTVPSPASTDVKPLTCDESVIVGTLTFPDVLPTATTPKASDSEISCAPSKELPIISLTSDSPADVEDKDMSVCGATSGNTTLLYPDEVLRTLTSKIKDLTKCLTWLSSISGFPQANIAQARGSEDRTIKKEISLNSPKAVVLKPHQCQEKDGYDKITSSDTSLPLANSDVCALSNTSSGNPTCITPNPQHTNSNKVNQKTISGCSATRFTSSLGDALHPDTENDAQQDDILGSTQNPLLASTSSGLPPTNRGTEAGHTAHITSEQKSLSSQRNRHDNGISLPDMLIELAHSTVTEDLPSASTEPPAIVSLTSDLPKFIKEEEKEMSVVADISTLVSQPLAPSTAFSDADDIKLRGYSTSSKSIKDPHFKSLTPGLPNIRNKKTATIYADKTLIQAPESAHSTTVSPHSKADSHDTKSHPHESGRLLPCTQNLLVLSSTSDNSNSKDKNVSVSAGSTSNDCSLLEFPNTVLNETQNDVQQSLFPLINSCIEKAPSRSYGCNKVKGGDNYVCKISPEVPHSSYAPIPIPVTNGAQQNFTPVPSISNQSPLILPTASSLPTSEVNKNDGMTCSVPSRISPPTSRALTQGLSLISSATGHLNSNRSGEGNSFPSCPVIVISPSNSPTTSTSTSNEKDQRNSTMIVTSTNKLPSIPVIDRTNTNGGSEKGVPVCSARSHNQIAPLGNSAPLFPSTHNDALQDNSSKSTACTNNPFFKAPTSDIYNMHQVCENDISGFNTSTQMVPSDYSRTGLPNANNMVHQGAFPVPNTYAGYSHPTFTRSFLANTTGPAQLISCRHPVTHFPDINNNYNSNNNCMYPRSNQVPVPLTQNLTFIPPTYNMPATNRVNETGMPLCNAPTLSPVGYPAACRFPMFGAFTQNAPFSYPMCFPPSDMAPTLTARLRFPNNHRPITNKIKEVTVIDLTDPSPSEGVKHDANTQISPDNGHLTHQGSHSSTNGISTEKAPKQQPVSLSLPEDNSYTCGVCAKKGFSENEMVEHLKYHGLRSPYCKQCNTRFFNHIAMFAHFPCPNQTPNEKPSKPKKKYYKSSKGKKKVHICDICQKAFPGLLSMERHKKANHSSTRCDPCNKTFPTRKQYLHHLRRHQGKKNKRNERELCHICGKTQTNIMLHLRTIHESPNYRFLCEICGHWSKEAAYHNMHLKTHNKIKPHKCKICSKGFNRSDYLQKHMESHKKEKDRPFKCSNCGNGFTRKPYLMLHLKKAVCMGLQNRRSKSSVGKRRSKRAARKTSEETESSENEEQCENGRTPDANNRTRETRISKEVAKKRLKESSESVAEDCSDDMISDANHETTMKHNSKRMRTNSEDSGGIETEENCESSSTDDTDTEMRSSDKESNAQKISGLSDNTIATETETQSDKGSGRKRLIEPDSSDTEDCFDVAITDDADSIQM